LLPKTITRLDILGLMTVWNPEQNQTVGGNYGLMDQQLSIKFVYENSKHIGGNGDKITINGQSAGSSSVAVQIVHRDAGLFIKWKACRMTLK
jgi:para-nitrobenzyl esterase